MEDEARTNFLESQIQVERKVRRSFDRRTLEILIGCLKSSYHTVAESHDSSLGFNNQTFGYSLFHVNVHNQSQAAVENPDSMRLISQSPIHRLEIGEFELGSYRVGNSEDADIWSSFPTSNGAVKTMVATSYLPGFEKPDLLQAKHIILAHVGNPDDLLCAAYLCIPTSLGIDDRISEWGFVYPVFVESEVIAPTTNASDQPAEQVETAVLKLRDEMGKRRDADS